MANSIRSANQQLRPWQMGFGSRYATVSRCQDRIKSLRIIRSNRAATNLAAYILRSNFSGSSDGSTKQRKWKEKRSQGQDPKPTFVSHVNLALAVTACCRLYGTKLTSVSCEHWPSFAAEADAKYDDNDEKSEDDGQRREEPDVKSIHLNNPANSHRFSLPTKVHVVYSTFFCICCLLGCYTYVQLLRMKNKAFNWQHTGWEGLFFWTGVVQPLKRKERQAQCF